MHWPASQGIWSTPQRGVLLFTKALATPEDGFIIVPFNILPSEESDHDPRRGEEARRKDDDAAPSSWIRSQYQCIRTQLEPPNGTVNTDVEEANYLMRRVVRRLSVDSPDDNPAKITLYLTSTEFSSNLYGECLANFKTRLGLEKSDDSMMVLRSVVMSLFASLSSKGDFINMLGETFKQVLEEEVKVCRARNEDSPDYHSFLMHGTDPVFLMYRPMFDIAKHSHQIIAAVELDEAGGKAYRALKGNTEEAIILKSSDKIDLEGLLQGVASGKRTSFFANMITESNGTIHSRLQVSLLFPFYIYGTPSDAHIHHILTRAPKITLSASSDRLVLDSQPATDIEGSNTLSDEDPNSHASGISIGISPATIGASLPSGHAVTNGAPPPVPSDNVEAALASGAILTLSSHHERPLQPFPSSNDALPFPFFFRAGAEFAVKIWADPAHPSDSICGV
ncbi:hypothetical protein B0T18DRAFT_386951 [Schizothecium vesticola]|uniref:Uncharacterized protein n=1 Tax=Schizothecium vesticola TaxID=314040 RepID=A0AA40F3W3_9PEZI|nr:hypothetical protein B0T18DRAFT_386951 [Schizothecium vesticola]